MGSRLKEDERNEKAIRSLLRKVCNRRCINCNSLGPQYVCLNFWTFVCTQCSGIHREFTHRVKSVSMSKFTSQEVANLESGGNERGKEIYFKDWDSQRQPLPDSSNADRVREFIKMVYVDKRFSGERPLPRPRGGDREESYDGPRRERSNYRSDSRSPSYDDRYDERPSGGRRSNAGYDDRRFDERGRFDEKRSPARFDSDRNRYDRNYNDARRFDDRPRYETRDRQQYEDRHKEGLDRRFEDRNHGGNSPPSVRPVSEILGENVSLRVEAQGLHTNGGRDLDKSSHSFQDGRQRFGSSSSFGSVDGNVTAAAPVVKREDSTSLIDFSAEPEPAAVREQPDPFGLTAAAQPSADALSSTGWATFGQAAPASFAETFAQPPTGAPALSISGGFTNPTSQINENSQWAAPTSFAETFAQPPTGTPAPSISGGFTNPASHINGNSQWAALWAPTSVPPAVDPNANSWSVLGGPSAPVVTSQPWNAFSANSGQANAHLAQQAQNLHDSQNISAAAGAASHVIPAQPLGRQEISEDIFGGALSNQFTGAQPYGSQYPSMGGMGMLGNYSQPQKSRNPFDLPGDSGFGPVAGEFPSLSTMQAALPSLNMGPRPVPAPAFGAYGSQWNQPNAVAQPQALYSSGLLTAGSGGYLNQQSTVMPPAMQGSMGHPLGGIAPGSFYNAPKQTTEPFFAAPNFQQLPPQNSFGGAQNSFTPQGAGSYHNPLGPIIGNSASPDSFSTGSLGPRLLSQSSVGSVSSLQSGDSLFPSQPQLPGQRLVSHASLGSLNSFSGADTQFSVQPAPQFPSRSSLGPVGNPFG